MSASSIQLKKLWWAGPLTVSPAIYWRVARAYHCNGDIAPALCPGTCDGYHSNRFDPCSLHWRSAGVRTGWAFCEEADTHLYHHIFDISCHQLFARHCRRFCAHAGCGLALFHHFDDHARGGGFRHRLYAYKINRVKSYKRVRCSERNCRDDLSK